MRDADVRSAVLQLLRNAHQDESTTRIVEEMGIWSGTVRIDIAVINGELSGVELKSDRDTLDRLPTQADLYSRVFDRMTLVVGAKHLEKALPMIPCWWGIVAATWQEDRVDLNEVRPVNINPSHDPFLVAQLLWKEEAIGALDARGLAKGWKSKSAAAIHRRLADSLSIEELRLEVRTALKARAEWLRQPIADVCNMAV